MSLVGHDDAWSAWRAAISGSRLHHAWLLAGRKGLGKAGFAIAAAEELVREGASQTPRPHPDILVLQPLPDKEEDARKKAEGKPFRTKRNISVDQVREVQRRLTTRPTLGSRRAVIIDTADELERGAANALLKSLEEPPQGTVFLLISHRAGQLPPTIRSRCRLLRFPDLGAAEIAAVLDRHAPELKPGVRDAAIAASCGSPGAALDFLAHELAPLQRLMSQIMAEGDPDLVLRGKLVVELGARPDRDRLVAVLELARRELASAAGSARKGQQAPIVEAHAKVSALLAEATTFNYEAGVLMLEIGGLLASAAAPRETGE